MNLDRTKAWEYLHKGLAIMEPLVAQHPKNEEYVRGLAYFYNNRAMEYVTKNEPAAALEEHEKAIKLRRGLVRDYPNDTKYMHRWYLARSLMRAAQAGQKLEKAEVALARYRECRDLLTRLVNDSPAHLDYRNDLALCSNSYGLLLMERKKGEDALANFKLSADHLDRIVAADPARTSAQVRLSEAYSSAALALVELGRRAEAEAELQQALKHCRTAMEQQPKETSHRALLTNLLARSLTNNAALQRHPDAARAASERRQLWSKSADELFRLGCDLAQCMNLVGTGKGELSPTQEADRAKYGDLAVKTLRQAAAAGFSKVQEFEQGPALAPLRGRTDYQNLLKELATKR